MPDTRGCKDFKYLVLQTKQVLTFPEMKHRTKGDEGWYCGRAVGIYR